MIPKYFDIHSHLNDETFNGDIEGALARMRAVNVWTIVVGTDKKSSQSAVQLGNFYRSVFSSIGVHPTDNREDDFDEEYFKKLAATPRMVAVGECGLDYSRIDVRDTAEKDRQKDLFERQLEFAVSIDKPLMIHCRDAHADMLSILATKKKEHANRLRGDIHFFTGDIDTAKKYFDLDFSISFTGVVTFAGDYDDVVRYAPQNRIMAETDSPYVAPKPHRGRRNEPFFVTEVVKRIAAIRKADEQETARVLTKNAFTLFDIEKQIS